ncbi:hypothetical protein ACHQM5_027107 [Ranunculus cassubicifolius]
MGRGKIEIKRIENNTNRQVTFSKRKNGILKKAHEITILCGARVSLVIFNQNEKFFEFHSHSLKETLKEYQDRSGNKLWNAKHQNLQDEVNRIKKENDRMLAELRHLKGEDINSLTARELHPIELALDNGITKIREMQQRMMEEENRLLILKLGQQEQQMNGNANARDLKHVIQQKEEEYPYQMPFSYRVQPTQPNLQDN